MKTNAPKNKKSELVPVSVFAKLIGIDRMRVYKLIKKKWLKTRRRKGLLLIPIIEARHFKAVKMGRKVWQVFI